MPTIVAVITGILMFSTFSTNWIGVRAPIEWNEFDHTSDVMVDHTVRYAMQHGSAVARGGFLSLDENEPYLSQAGTQGIIYAATRPRNDAQLESYFTHARLVLALLLALVLSLFVAAVASEFGAICGITTGVLLALSVWFVIYAHSTYWVAFTLVLPFSASWWLYPRTRRVWLVPLVVGAATMLKALCGYEFISNVIAAAAVPVFWYERDWSIIARRVTAIGLAGAIGFFAAIGVHVAQGAHELGSVRAGLAPIVYRALARTCWVDPSAPLGAPIGARGTLAAVVETQKEGMGRGELGTVTETRGPRGIRAALAHYNRYMAKQGLTMPWHGTSLQIPIGAIQGVGLVAIVLAIALGYRRKFNAAWVRIGRLGRATAFAFLATHSWIVLAKNHMGHFHLNGILWFVPFAPMVYLLVTEMLVTTVRERRNA